MHVASVMDKQLDTQIFLGLLHHISVSPLLSTASKGKKRKVVSALNYLSTTP
jgi:hypothetical protein